MKMKKNIYSKVLSVLAIAIIMIVACTKEPEDVRLDPKLSTDNYADLKSDSVIVTGFILSAGSGFSEKGVCFSTEAAPTIDDSKVVYSGDESKAAFKVKLKVNRLTTYYVRAYAINTTGVIYGEEFSFTTPAALPTLATITASTLEETMDKGITAATAINITDDGGPDPTAEIKARGVVYGPNPNPSLDSLNSKIAANKTISTTEGSGDGEFASLATNLKGNVKYYLRAYATNGIGTGYSNEVSFTTAVGYPFIQTKNATKISKTTATLNGVVTYNGGGTISEKGFCYSLTANPTVASTKVVVSSAKDTISADITGLEIFTKYHVRAYVKNEKGINYGEDITFTTLPNITKYFVVGAYNGWTNSDAALYIISTATDPEAQGYIYFENAGDFKLTTDHSWDDAHTFGDDGTKTGKLSNAGGGKNITVTDPGYYLIKANPSTMTYSFTKTTWGIIGDATAGGWDNQTNMSYNSTSKIFYLAANLTGSKHFKFRGTSNWDVNYGSTAEDGKTLNSGGKDILVTLTDDYAITLDLSHPNDYTYSANRWGLIGSATPGQWDSDQNMTWDAINKVFKITLDLTAGKIKFRANDDWGVNYGGDLNALTAGGSDISVDVAGNYTITFDPWGLKATVTKN